MKVVVQCTHLQNFSIQGAVGLLLTFVFKLAIRLVEVIPQTLGRRSTRSSTILLHNFQTSFLPGRNLSVDETMVGFRGRFAAKHGSFHACRQGI